MLIEVESARKRGEIGNPKKYVITASVEFGLEVFVVKAVCLITKGATTEQKNLILTQPLRPSMGSSIRT